MSFPKHRVLLLTLGPPAVSSLSWASGGQASEFHLDF